jgi:hypothetical protein
MGGDSQSPGRVMARRTRGPTISSLPFESIVMMMSISPSPVLLRQCLTCVRTRWAEQDQAHTGRGGFGRHCRLLVAVLVVCAVTCVM